VAVAVVAHILEQEDQVAQELLFLGFRRVLLLLFLEA
jgi:hypothetical protein